MIKPGLRKANCQIFNLSVDLDWTVGKRQNIRQGKSLIELQELFRRHIGNRLPLLRKCRTGYQHDRRQD
jgi:hypothetical protein